MTQPRLDTDHYATKADLRELQLTIKADLLELETRLQRFLLDQQKFIVQALVGMTAIFAFIVGLFRIFG